MGALWLHALKQQFLAADSGGQPDYCAADRHRTDFLICSATIYPPSATEGRRLVKRVVY